MHASPVCPPPIPLQTPKLGAYPEFVDDTDTAAQAEVYEVPLQHGDIIVAGSDGLWDNAYEAEILGRLPRSAEGAQVRAPPRRMPRRGDCEVAPGKAERPAHGGARARAFAAGMVCGLI